MRLVGLSSALLLLLLPALLLLAAQRPAAGYSLSENSREDAQDAGDISDTTTDTTDISDTTNDTTTDTTDSSDTTTDTTTDTSDTTTDTITTTTTEAATETPPLNGLGLYEDTREELRLISDVLDKFDALVNPEADAAPAAASARRMTGGRGHPAAWWLRGQAARPQESIYSFCVDLQYELCITLETQLAETDNLVADLRGNVDAWQNSDLTQLRQLRQELNGTYHMASEDSENFKVSVDETSFTQAIGEVKQDVQDGLDAVQEKINEIDPPSDSGSVALVAVIGSVGGLMIVSILGVLVYAAVKNSRSKKQRSAAPHGKNKGENIPIDAFAQDAPRSRPASSMDPYSQAPVPAPRSPYYASPYDPRKEPAYPESVDSRPQRGLRRTYF